MFLYLIYVLASSSLVEQAMIGSVSFKLNTILVASPVYPSFTSWDMNYTALFEINSNDTLEIKATAIYSFPSIFISVNKVPFVPFPNNTFVRLPQLTDQINTIEIFTSYYTRYHTYVNYTYVFNVFVQKIPIFAQLTAENVTCSGSSIDNFCKDSVSMNANDLNLTVFSNSSSQILIRHLSLVNSSSYYSIFSGIPFTFPLFFSNWFENVLEITVMQSQFKQIFYFRINKSAPNTEIISTSVSFDVPVFFSGWNLMPRFHPQVFNYTLVPSFPSLAYGNTHFIVNSQSILGCTLNLNPLNLISTYEWTTNTYSQSLWMSVKSDSLSFFCYSLDFSYVSENYTIYYYRLSKNTNIAKVLAFINPLVPSPVNLASNSSMIPANFQYLYDTSKINYWTQLSVYSPPQVLVLNYSAFSSVMTFNPIEYPSTLSALTLIFIPSDYDAYFIYNMNKGPYETDYLFSHKSVYPIVPGTNTVFLNITAEDPLYTIYNIYRFPVLSPDTAIKSFVSYPVLNQSVSQFTYNINITVFNNFVTINLALNNSNAQVKWSAPNITFFNSSVFNLSLSQNSSIFNFYFQVVGESRNFVQNYSVIVQRIDICGDGRRWNSNEKCDDGNDIQGDGCFNCMIEAGWGCGGGSFYSRDFCTKLNNSITGNLTQSNNASTSSSNQNSTTNQNISNFTQDFNTSQSSPNTNLTNSQTNFTQDQNQNSNQMNNSASNSSNANQNSGTNTYFEDQNKVSVSESYFFFVFLIFTLIILFFHALAGIYMKNLVFNTGIFGLNSNFMPMIHCFQLFFIISQEIKQDHMNLLVSFEWALMAGGDFTGNQLLDSNFGPIVGIFLVIFIYFAIKVRKNGKIFKRIHKLWNLSIFVYSAYFILPIFTFNFLKNLQNINFTENHIISFTFSLIGLLLNVYLLVIIFVYSSKYSKNYEDKSVFEKFGGFFEGLRYKTKVVPADIVNRDKSDENIEKKFESKQGLKRHNSLNTLEIEEKPKFYSVPWKNLTKTNLLQEISSFSLSEPNDNALITKSIENFNSNPVIFNYYPVNLLIFLTSICFLTSNIEINFKISNSMILQLINFWIVFKIKPFIQRIYFLLHLSRCLFQSLLFFVLFFEDKQDIGLIIMALALFSLFFCTSLYEILFFFRTFSQKLRFRRGLVTVKTKEQTEDNEKNVMFKSEIKFDARIKTEPACIENKEEKRVFSNSYEVDNTLLVEKFN